MASVRVCACVCGNPRRTSRHSQGPQYVCAHMCACNSIAHARRRCVRRPDDGTPVVVSVCPSSPVAWSPFNFLSAVRDAGVCTPIGGDAVVIAVRHAVFSVCFPFVRGVPGVRFLFSRAVSPCSGGVFDTPVDPGVCNGSGVFRCVRVCVGSGFGVGFSLAARRGTVPFLEGFGSGSVRWWFENSRACFVLLLYSQMIASPSTARAFACGCREAG